MGPGPNAIKPGPRDAVKATSNTCGRHKRKVVNNNSSSGSNNTNTVERFYWQNRVVPLMHSAIPLSPSTVSPMAFTFQSGHRTSSTLAHVPYISSPV